MSPVIYRQENYRETNKLQRNNILEFKNNHYLTVIVH